MVGKGAKGLLFDIYNLFLPVLSKEDLCVHVHLHVLLTS